MVSDLCGVPQLFAEVLVLIVVIPTLLPQVCGATGDFGIFLRPVCGLVSVPSMLFEIVAHLRQENPRIRRLPLKWPDPGRWRPWRSAQGRARCSRKVAISWWAQKRTSLRDVVGSDGETGVVVDGGADGKKGKWWTQEAQSPN